MPHLLIKPWGGFRKNEKENSFQYLLSLNTKKKNRFDEITLQLKKMFVCLPK